MTLAQLINVLYSTIDRIYIGHLPNASTEALTGIGLTLPIITIITAFTNLFGMGGGLCSPSNVDVVTRIVPDGSWETLSPCCC